MILRRDATKLEGVRRLAERYGLPLERVAAFGDDYGDIPLLRACGVWEWRWKTAWRRSKPLPMPSALPTMPIGLPIGWKKKSVAERAFL